LLWALPVAVGFNAYFAVGLAGWYPESWRVPIHTYWVGVVSNLILMVVAYGLSFVWPSDTITQRTAEPVVPTPAPDSASKTPASPVEPNPADHGPDRKNT